MKKIKVILLLIVSTLIVNQELQSQEQNKSIENTKQDTSNISSAKKAKFGCGFGLNFVGGTNLNVSPNIIFPITNKMSLGAGLQFNYLSIKNFQTTTTIGANALLQYNLSNKIMTTLEFVQLRVSTKDKITNAINNFWDTALFFGAGINITNTIALGAKYNVLYKESQSIYTGPIIPFVNITF
ncbi:MAG: hypothetical protein KGZ59_10825 [Chitinophagaceae bacterium]|nr:hypothetical protein [Chitinophagaceae bacterium]